MLSQYQYLEWYIKDRVNQLQREAEAARLVQEASRYARQAPSLRVRVADGLYALAARVEGQPRRPLFNDELGIAA